MRDGTAPRDAVNGPWLAGHGFAHIRVDMRGAGDSDGLLLDEYLPGEQRDALEVIEWIARQPWCSGRVAMMGLSWGAFAGLQVAALRPPALSAVIAIGGVADRYATDVHYMGGALLNDNSAWGGVMLGYLARPPDPLVVGDRWRPMWLERLDNAPLMSARWLEHQRRDDYWRHGSIGDDFDALTVPVLAVSGWSDGYAPGVPALLEGMPDRVQGLVGPWVHRYPHIGLPEPRIGFLQLVRDWLGEVLTGGSGSETLRAGYVAYLRDSGPPSPDFPPRPGRWIAEPGWPSPNVETRWWALDAGGLCERAGSSGVRRVRSPETVGIAGGRFMPLGVGGEGPADQRVDDEGSIVFDGPEVAERMEILGAPAVELELSCDQPQANVCVRLCDVGPDGASLRITYGVLNLSHRYDHVSPAPLVPGRRERVRIRMHHTAHALLPGRRLRVAISTAYWPLIWPAPARATLTLHTGAGQLELPVRTGRGAAPPPFDEPEGAPALATEELRSERAGRTVERGEDGAVVVRDLDDAGARRILAHGLEYGGSGHETYVIRPDDPLSARASCEWTHVRARGPWRVRVHSRCEMHATAHAFYLRARLAGYEDDEAVHERSWEHVIPRDHL